MAKAAAFTIVPDAQTPEGSFVRIMLQDMEVDVRIGLHPHEQENGRRQKVLVNIELFAALGDYLRDPDRESIIDYDHIYNAVKSWAERPHTLLIETYLAELVPICFAEPRITACRVSVSKPEVFPDVENVGVEVFVRRADFEG